MRKAVLRSLSVLGCLLAVFAGSALLQAQTTIEGLDIVERTFPYLKRVTDAGGITADKTYVLVAHNGVRMIAVKEVADERTIRGEEISAGVQPDKDNMFRFTPQSGISFLQGMGLSYGYSKTDNKTILPKNDRNAVGFKFKSGPATCGELKYGPAVVLGHQNSSLHLAVNMGLAGSAISFRMFTSYDDAGDIPPAFVYEYAEGVEPVGMLEIATEEGYGTCYNEVSYVMPVGVTGYAVTEADAGAGDLSLEAIWSEGETVPAGTALLVKGRMGSYPLYAPRDGEDASFFVSSLSADALGRNLLQGTASDGPTTAPAWSGEAEWRFYKLYYLTPADGVGERQLGFFWGAEDGGAFTNKGGRAYLSLPYRTGVEIRGFTLPSEGGTVTGIPVVQTSSVNAPSGKIYTLRGTVLRAGTLAGLPAGVYIMNGRKVIVK